MRKFGGCWLLAIAGVSLTVTGSASAAAGKRTWKPEVNGQTFRVTLDEHEVVNVVKKSIISGQSMTVRDDMRLAVRQATGCELVDEMWAGAKLKGRLKCPEGHVSPPADRSGT